MKLNRIIFHILIFSVMFMGTAVIHGCGPSDNAGNCCAQKVEEDTTAGENMAASEKSSAVVTFIELGSSSCVPCRMMQPVMNSIEKRYGPRVKIIFQDVMTPEGRPLALKFGIRAIPTQVFLDSEGNEFFRHVGFFPEKEIDKILGRKGLNQ